MEPTHQPPIHQPPPPPENAPFEPGQTRPLVGGRGCGKPVVIGCVVLLVLVALGLVGLIWYFTSHLGEIMDWQLRESKELVLTRLPEDFTPAERQRVERAFDAAREEVKQEGFDLSRAQAVQQQLLDVARNPGERLTREQVERLTRTLEELSGIEGEGEPP
jgi:hypothetical protein